MSVTSTLVCERDTSVQYMNGTKENGDPIWKKLAGSIRMNPFTVTRVRMYLPYAIRVKHVVGQLTFARR